MNRPTFHARNHAGFTLVEVVLAIGIVAAVMIPLVLLLGTGMDYTHNVLLRDKALRLVPAIEQRLNALPYSQVESLASSGGSLYAYIYRPPWAPGGEGNVAAARPLAEAGIISAESGSIEGPMFRVRLERAEQQANEASIEINARISQIADPRRWQSGTEKSLMTLNFVVNR